MDPIYYNPSYTDSLLHTLILGKPPAGNRPSVLEEGLPLLARSQKPRVACRVAWRQMGLNENFDKATIHNPTYN